MKENNPKVNYNNTVTLSEGFPGGSDCKVSAHNAGDQGSIFGLGKSPGEGNGNRLQYSCLENSMNEGSWWATVHGVTKSQTLSGTLRIIWYIVIQRIRGDGFELCLLPLTKHEGIATPTPRS